jgi:hypothetical protein
VEFWSGLEQWALLSVAIDDWVPQCWVGQVRMRAASFESCLRRGQKPVPEERASYSLSVRHKLEMGVTISCDFSSHCASSSWH